MKLTEHQKRTGRLIYQMYREDIQDGWDIPYLEILPKAVRQFLTKKWFIPKYDPDKTPEENASEFYGYI